MSTIDFNSLIYTASKSLKKSDVRATPEVNQDINNVLQDKMLHAVQHKALFKQEMSIKSWFFQVLNKTLATSLHKEGESEATNAVTQETDSIHQVMNELEKDLLVPFMMHFQGYKLGDIAEELNLSIETVSNRLEAAREFLVHRMGKI